MVAPEPAAKAETVRVQDDFEDGELDEMVWSPFYTGTGGTLGEQNGRLELTIQADAKGAGPWRMVAAQVGTHCRFPGDFDFRVEYELLVWPEASGANLILAAWGGDAFSTVSRLSGPTFESYTSNIFNRSYQAPRADVQGMLRLRRAAGIVTAFFRQEGEWIVLDRKQMHGTVTAGLQLLATDPQFPHVEVRTAFDNVALEGESPQCPGGTPA